jgi:hypothetical protein
MNAWTGLAAGLAIEELETELLLEAIFQRFGHDFRAFDRAALRAKLNQAVREAGAATLSGLQEQALHDARAASKLLRALSVTPAPLFDCVGHAARLRSVLAPSLRGWPVPRVWLAECAGVGEAWTLAIVLAEEGVLGKLDIHATLANEELVAGMQDACLPVAALEEARQRHLESGGRGDLRSLLRDRGRPRWPVRAPACGPAAAHHLVAVQPGDRRLVQRVPGDPVLPRPGRLRPGAAPARAQAVPRQPGAIRRAVPGPAAVGGGCVCGNLPGDRGGPALV